MITPNDLLTTTWNCQSTQTWPAEWEKFAVIGDPINHSLSPAIHNAAFRSLQGLHPQLTNHYYGKIHVKPQELAEAIHSLHKQNFQGINITVPHKITVMQHLSALDESAKQMGAVNTLVWEENGYKGYNTDAYGLLQALHEDLKINLKKTPVLIIGAGGAAQTAAATCLKAGCPELWITNRSQDRLDAVINFLKQTYPQQSKSIHSFALKETFPTALPKTSLLIIQSTSLGLHLQDPQPISLDAFDKSCKLFEIIYNPWQTPLITQANQRGIETTNGISMFLHQAAMSFKIWTTLTSDIDLMRSVVLSHLRLTVA